MSSVERDLVDLLRRYMPEILAQAMRRRALESLGLGEGDLRAEHLARLQRELASGVRLFVEAAKQEELLRDLRELYQSPDETRERIEILQEHDVSKARSRARQVALELGGSAFAAQRIATVVSELCRNIVAYAGDGVVELVPLAGPPPMLSVCAIDSGPGIVDAEKILSGHYRSKSGLGMGLVGVKRLAANFDLDTGPAGTRVQADLDLT